METITFLAMTAAEIANVSPLPPNIAWMACHFSPYGTGLSNLPRQLPERSLLILNDRIPICGHDPQQILTQLQEALERLCCAGLLLDFQRPDVSETAQVVHFLSGALEYPVAVSDTYAKESEGPVFLPPLPHHVYLPEYLAPWKGREVWMEMAADVELITLTSNGSAISSGYGVTIPDSGFSEIELHCHYKAELSENSAEFTLWRTKEDLKALLEEAQKLGIRNTVGLYQEFKTK